MNTGCVARALFSALLVLLFAGCGSRTGVGGLERLDAGVRDGGPAVDTGHDAGRPPETSRLSGVWRFHTIRAVCDTLAIAFCERRVLARLSTDDLCDGANPTDPEPSVAAVEWLGATEARLTATFAGQPVRVHFALIGAPDRRDDRLQLIAFDGPIGFPWDHAIRDEAASEPLPSGFVGCN